MSSGHDIYNGTFRNAAGRDVTVVIVKSVDRLALRMSGAEIMSAPDTAEGAEKFAADLIMMGRILTGAAASSVLFHRDDLVERLTGLAEGES